MQQIFLISYNYACSKITTSSVTDLVNKRIAYL